jgi:hypothetical protein
MQPTLDRLQRHVVNDRRDVDFHAEHRIRSERLRCPALFAKCGDCACGSVEQAVSLHADTMGDAFGVAEGDGA